MKTFQFSRKVLSFTAIVTLFVFALLAPAFASETLQEAIHKALLSNPDVQQKWHAFQAAGFEINAAEGGFRPQVDINAGVGRDSIDGEGYEDRDFSDYSHHGYGITLRQMIYDGGLTSNQVKRLGHMRMVRYYELLSAMESVSLDTLRAYEDVMRYRHLYSLAMDNEARHEEVMKMVNDRVQKGFDSRSSLEEIKGRLAVARVNRLTEEANLHDVSARYERLVGELPPEEMDPLDMDLQIPTCADLALQKALKENPSLYAGREKVLASQAALQEKIARLRPRLDLKGGFNSGHDRDGVEGRKDKWYGELVLTYNLIDGGTRKSTIDQYRELQQQSEEGLHSTGRDIRQILNVAYNDLQMLSEQLGFLEKHRSSSNEVRKAYSQQFRIGRRELLDLLDVENEFYQASRALSNAESNITISRGRVLASMGELTSAFGFAREDLPSLEDLGVESSRYEFGPAHDALGDDCFCETRTKVEEIGRKTKDK
jgi:adhesin transport system outer membrane protein